MVFVKRELRKKAAILKNDEFWRLHSIILNSNQTHSMSSLYSECTCESLVIFIFLIAYLLMTAILNLSQSAGAKFGTKNSSETADRVLKIHNFLNACDATGHNARSTFACYSELHFASLQCRHILNARVYIFVLGRHLGFGDCWGLGRREMC